MGFLDKTGKLVIPAVYDSKMPFSEGLAAVELNNKWGFIDKTGQLVIEAKYDDFPKILGGGYYFTEGLCRVLLNGKFGFIDNKGDLVIPPKYDWVEPFSEGLAPR